MKIKKGFILKTVGGRDMAIATGEEFRDNNFIITLNETSRFMWEQLECDITMDELVAAVLDTYDADEATVRHDASVFVAKLTHEGILEK